MAVYLQIEGIIFHIIFIERNLMDWDEYKMNIIQKLNTIDLKNKIENYIPCGKMLHLSRPKMRTILYKSIMSNNRIFLEVGYDNYQVREQYNITRQNINDFIEQCIKILVKKQQCK